MEEKKTKFSWRAFISLGLLYSFIIIFITGIILYISPSGRIAHWVNWKFLGFTKESWQSIHTVFSFIFVVLSIFHLFTINWKVFWSHLKKKKKKGLNKKKEFYLSSILTIFIFLSVVFSIPPFSLVMDLGEYATESWENEDTEPPIPHAELLTLIELSEQLEETSLEKIENTLKANDIKYNNTKENLTEIGELNNITPIEIYNIIINKTLSGMAGSGIGNKTLEEFAKENNKDLNNLIKILKKNNIKLKKGLSLREIASENDMAAKDIYELIK